MEEYIEEIESMWESHWLTNMGVKHQKLQTLLKSYLEVENVELLTNGHMALEMTLQAFDFPKGSEVITTPFTFASTTHAIVRNGLVPVFCDIKESDYTIDERKIEALITEKTVAIMPVHVYGNVCNVTEIDRIAKKYDLKVIYDAAHAFGEKYTCELNGEKKSYGIGYFGEASCFSFHATKVFNTIEGGAVCFKNPDLGHDLYNLKNFGIQNEVSVTAVGANAKMNEFCAAMGICNLRHLPDEIEKRSVVYSRYMELLSGIDGIRLNVVQDGVKSNYAYFPIVVDENVVGCTRDDIHARLEEHNIVARKYFYPLVSDFECYRDDYDSSKTPVAKYVSERVLTLPMYSDLSIENVERICKIVQGK